MKEISENNQTRNYSRERARTASVMQSTTKRESCHMCMVFGMTFCTRTPPRSAHYQLTKSGDCHGRPRDIQIKCSDSQRENGHPMRRPFVAFSTFAKTIESISSDRSAWDEVGKKNGLGELAARLKVSASGQITISAKHVAMAGDIQMRVELGRQLISFAECVLRVPSWYFPTGN